ARLVAAVDDRRGVQRHETARLDLSVAVEDHLLDQLLVGQRLAEGDAIVGAVAHEVEGALGLSEPAHDVEDASRAEALLGDDEAVPAGAEQILLRYADVVVFDLAMSSVMSEDGGVADDVVAGSVRRHDDH